MRQGLLCAWLGLGTLLLLATFLLLLSLHLSPAELAALVERPSPEIGERLTSAIGLSGPNPEGSGSPVFIALLLRDAEDRCRQLDFRAAVPGRHTRRCALLPAVSLLVALAPGAYWPEESAAQAWRFFRPWGFTPPDRPAPPGVTPGHAFAARGRPLSVVARFQPGDDRLLPPPPPSLPTSGARKSARRWGWKGPARSPPSARSAATSCSGSRPGPSPVTGSP